MEFGSNSQTKNSSKFIFPMELVFETPLTKEWETVSLLIITTDAPGLVEIIVLSKYWAELYKKAFSAIITVRLFSSTGLFSA